MTRPPRLAARILDWWLRGGDRDEVLGDLDEQFSRLARSGARRARVWYWRQTLHLLRRFGPRRRAPHVAGSEGRQLMLVDDLRHAVRRLRVHPARALITIAMLAAAIGVSTATFAVLDSLVLERAPFRDPETLRTVRIRFTYGSDNPELIRLIRAWRHEGLFERAEAAAPIASSGTAAQGTLPAAQVTPGLLEMLGVRPVRGRAFTDEDARAGADRPVLISARVWRTAFGADPAVLGRRIPLNGQEYRLIGVMPADFRFPSWDTVMWVPLPVDATPFPRSALAYVRLPQDIPEPDVLVRATAIAGVADPRFTARPNELFASPIGGRLDEYAGRAVPLFAGAVGLVFLALCASACGVLLAQLTSRRREFGLRASLGASRARLLRQAAIEHLLIGGGGVAAGIGLAHALTTGAPPLLSEGFNLTQSLNLIDIDARALWMTGVLGLLVVIVCGVLPAWIGTRVDAAASMRLLERGSTESRAARSLTRTLLVAQIAFASMLLVGAALLVRSVERMANADRGMDPRGLYRVNAFMSSVEPGVLEAMHDRFAAMPGIEGVTIAGSAPPTSNATWTGQLRSEFVGSGIETALKLYEVRPDFFGFYGITLLRGRFFHAGDDDSVAIVGERIASLLWPDVDPLGRTMDLEGRQFQVVGVASEITLPSLDEGDDLPELYLPFSGRRSVLAISWRCLAACPERQQVIARLKEVDPGATALGISSIENDYSRELVRPRAAAQLGTIFGAVAFLTSGAGLFAMLSYAVGRRRREFGVRTALGATPGRLRRTVLTDAAQITGLGLTAGAIGAYLLGGLLGSVLYGVSPHDPVAWSTTLAIVALTMGLASWRPSRQAARADPVELLREE